MNTEEQRAVCLEQREILRPGKGPVEMHCLSGRLWLTDGSGGEDHLLHEGDSILVEGGDWLCQAVGGTGAVVRQTKRR